MPTAREDPAEYAREYRRRRKLNGNKPLGYRRFTETGAKAHDACDRRIADLEQENQELKRLIAEAGF